MRLVHYNDTENYDIDFTHDWFLCRSGNHIFLSHLEFDEEDGYFVIDEHGAKHFMYDPDHLCEVYLILTEDKNDSGNGGPPYDAATATGMYDYD